MNDIDLSHLGKKDEDDIDLSHLSEAPMELTENEPNLGAPRFSPASLVPMSQLGKLIGSEDSNLFTQNDTSIRNIANTATLGLASPIMTGIGAAKGTVEDYLKTIYEGKNEQLPGSLSDIYEDLKNQYALEAKRVEQQEDNNKLGAIVGNVGGYLLPSGLPAKGLATLGKAIKGAKEVKDLGIAARTGLGVAEGLASGAMDLTREQIENLSGTRSDDRMSDPTTTLALGGILGAGANNLIPAIKGTAQLPIIKDFVKSRKSGLEGANIISTSGHDKVYESIFGSAEKGSKGKLGEFIDDMSKDFSQASINKVNRIKELTEQGTEVPISEVKMLWDDFYNSLDMDSVFAKDKARIKQLKVDFDNLFSKKEITKNIKKTIEPRIPSTEQELMSKAQVEAALQKQLGKSVEPSVLKVPSPEGEFQQAILSSGIPGEEAVQRLGSPKLAQPEIPQMTTFSPTETVSRVPTDIIPIKSADTGRVNLQSSIETAIKEPSIGGERPTLERMQGKLSSAINKTDKSLENFNNKISIYNDVGELFGLKFKDANGDLVSIGTLLDSVKNGNVAAAVAKTQIVPEAFSKIKQINPELAIKYEKSLKDLFDQFEQVNYMKNVNVLGMASPKYLANVSGNIAGMTQKGLTDFTKKTVPFSKKISEIGQELGNIPALKSKTAYSNLTELQQKPETPDEFSRRVYNFNNEQLDEAADKLLVDPSLVHLSNKIKKAIAENDRMGKNAAQFLIAQDKRAKKILQEK